MSEEKMAPEWVFDNNQATEYIDKKTLKSEDVNSILKLSIDITDNDVVMEKDRIEKSASSGSVYYYNMQWPSKIKDELKEYASVCGLDASKFKAVHPAELTSEIKVASDSKIIKTASVAESTRVVLSDPFHIDAKITNAHKKTKWQAEVKNASKLANRPIMYGIVPIRGGEDYFANAESKVARGQNSITSPDAIEKMAESTEEDTGARLKRENEAKKGARKMNHEEWQKEKVEAMDGKEILPHRRVFPTESMNAQPGIKGEVFDYSKMPEKTAGEQIKEMNKERKRQIRGEEKAKHEFVVAKNPARVISEDFGEELKKHLKQMD